MERKLRLINPVSRNVPGLSLTQSKYPPLGLGVVASLTPPSWRIELIDENIEEHRFGQADMVGISCFTATVSRGYEIAREYRENGIPVVFGGIHPSLLPAEALQHGDSVVIGDAENNWPELLNDFENGILKRVYNNGTCKGSEINAAKRDIFHYSYKLGLIQASRGCLFKCEFCSLSAFDGKEYRLRPIDNIVHEIEQIPQSFFWFTDNNLFGNSAVSQCWAKSLFLEMKKRNIKKTWLCFTNLNSAGSDEMLTLAHEAGCRMVFIGIEAEERTYINGISDGKHSKIKLSDLFTKIHNHGIVIFAGIIMGFDFDTPETIRRRVDFIINSQIDCYMATALTPFPGTKLYKQLSDDDRILFTSYPEDWEKYTWKNPVFKPFMMSHDQFCTSLTEAYRELYSDKTIRAKYRQTKCAIGDADIAYKSMLTNKDFAAVFNLEK